MLSSQVGIFPSFHGHYMAVIRLEARLAVDQYQLCILANQSNHDKKSESGTTYFFFWLKNDFAF